MSNAKASSKPRPQTPTSARASTDEQAESLTDLIDVLQRQSFIRRFDSPAEARVAERTDASSGSASRAPGGESSD